MKRRKLLYVIPVCMMLLTSPVSSIRTEAVTVDIKDNYDAGLLEQEQDSQGSGSERSDSASSASTQNNQTGAQASNAAASTPAATAASNTASSQAPAAATTASTVADAATTASTTNDLPKTGDDDRILITFTVMLTSFAVFMTTLLAGRIGKRA
jgi:hypothetical protein